MSAGFTRAHAAVLATALLFSTGGAAIKACGLTAWQVASFRSGVAALALALLVPAARRVSGRALLVAVAYAAHADFVRPGQQADHRRAGGVPAGGGAALRRRASSGGCSGRALARTRRPDPRAGRPGDRAAVRRLGRALRDRARPGPRQPHRHRQRRVLRVPDGRPALAAGRATAVPGTAAVGRVVGQRPGLRRGAAAGAAGRRLAAPSTGR